MIKNDKIYIIDFEYAEFMDKNGMFKINSVFGTKAYLPNYITEYFISKRFNNNAIQLDNRTANGCEMDMYAVCTMIIIIISDILLENKDLIIELFKTYRKACNQANLDLVFQTNLLELIKLIPQVYKDKDILQNLIEIIPLVKDRNVLQHLIEIIPLVKDRNVLQKLIEMIPLVKDRNVLLLFLQQLTEIIPNEDATDLLELIEMIPHVDFAFLKEFLAGVKTNIKQKPTEGGYKKPRRKIHKQYTRKRRTNKS